MGKVARIHTNTVSINMRRTKTNICKVIKWRIAWEIHSWIPVEGRPCPGEVHLLMGGATQKGALERGLSRGREARTLTRKQNLTLQRGMGLGVEEGQA